MNWILAVLLLVVPAVEIWLLAKLTVGFAVVWCLLTAGAGWYFARGESLTLWTEIESDLQNGRLPTIEAVDTMLVLLGGWGLIVPGILTDLLGATLLVPPLRRMAIDWIRRTLRLRFL